MTKQRNFHPAEVPIETWNEELSRARKFKEAIRKRNTQKQVEQEVEQFRKKSSIGRLRLEP